MRPAVSRRSAVGAAALAALLLLAAVAPAVESGDDQLIETTLADPKRKEEVPVKIWIPGGVKVLRGAIVQGLYDGLVRRTDYQMLARSLDFALVGAMMRKSEHLLPEALKEFAARSGHPEVEHFPLVTMGFSAGGGVAIRLATLMPDRVVAVVSNGNPGVGFKIDDPALVAAMRRTCVLTVNGSKDPFVDYDKAPERYWHNAHHPRLRQARLLWGLAMQWGKGHDYGNTNALAWPFLAEVVRVRVGERTALRGPVALADYPEAAAWLGDIATWESNWAAIRPFSEAEVACPTTTWLPGEGIAHLWRAFVSKDPPVAVTVVPDGGAPGRHVVRAEGRFPEGLAKVEFYSGSLLLGEAAAPAYEVRTDRLARGVHGVFGVCVLGNGGRLATQPVLRVDGQDPRREEAEAAAR